MSFIKKCMTEVVPENCQILAGGWEHHLQGCCISLLDVEITLLFLEFPGCLCIIWFNFPAQYYPTWNYCGMMKVREYGWCWTQSKYIASRISQFRHCSTDVIPLIEQLNCLNGFGGKGPFVYMSSAWLFICRCCILTHIAQLSYHRFLSIWCWRKCRARFVLGVDFPKPQHSWKEEMN